MTTYEENYTYGWICPRCGTVHAPHTGSCWCRPNTAETPYDGFIEIGRPTTLGLNPGPGRATDIDPNDFVHERGKNG